MSKIWVPSEKSVDDAKSDADAVQVTFQDMPLHMKHSVIDITQKAWRDKRDAGDRCEQIKRAMDKMYGGKWAVAIGEFAFFVSHSKLLRMTVSGQTVVIFLPLFE